METKMESPIKSGWRGNINGHLTRTTGSQINVTEVTLKVDAELAWALCNQLSDGAINCANAVEGKQITALSTLGAALGRLIDHPSANNGGRKCIK